MAKKKKNKEKPADAGAPPSSPPAAKVSEPIDIAFAAGNYAAVRRMAARNPDDKAKMLLELVTIDKVQFLIGIGALAIVLLVALTTLR